jgi:hypothetical protein
VPLLVELAELLAIPVVQQLSYVNFPTDHPLNLGVQPVKYVRRSDLLFFIDTDVPWEPPESGCSARRCQDHSPGARPDVYGDSRLGLSRRSAGDRMLGNFLAGFNSDHQSEAGGKPGNERTKSRSAAKRSRASTTK